MIPSFGIDQPANSMSPEMETQLEVLGYADDSLFCTHHNHDLRRVIQHLNTYARSSNAKANRRKNSGHFAI
ncbi:hypothetical protein BJV82DRAFT_92905 [Fennellomyces sp. T-0311]|nr:hypothetical protein BJV82DRAFT_92905 [Fennellomyces sp. T-0311]